MAKPTSPAAWRWKPLAVAQRWALLDLDPQGSLTRWWKRREADDLQLIEGIKEAGQISAACAALEKQGFEYLVIDTPGKRDDATRIALQSASIVIVPVHPSPDDLDAVGPTVAEILSAKAPFAFVSYSPEIGQ